MSSLFKPAATYKSTLPEGQHYCPNCAEIIFDDTFMCEKCSVIEAERRPLIKTLVITIILTITGYFIAFLGTIISGRDEKNMLAKGIATFGFVLGFFGGIAIMCVALKWIRTGSSGPIKL